MTIFTFSMTLPQATSSVVPYPSRNSLLKQLFRNSSRTIRIFPFLSIRNDTGMFLHRLFGGNDTAFLHQFVDPGDLSIFKNLQYPILHFKIVSRTD